MAEDSQPVGFTDDQPTSDTNRSYGSYTNQQWIMINQSTTWRPPTDVVELEDRLLISVEIAGMRDGGFNVSLQARRLIISGVRTRPEQEGTDVTAYHQVEVRYGRFQTDVILPWPVERDAITAVYRDGFLHVELPRARGQQIHIVDISDQDLSTSSNKIND